ncbi:MAG: DNA-protecting protein DprA, partial [Candidatus Eisenbacteria sp.]|nr:DNA-protecting protein DprA [Candidatus Eisenbacteria bacterium]
MGCGGTARAAESAAPAAGSALRWLARCARGFPPALGQVDERLAGLWVRSGCRDAELAQRLWGSPAVAVVGARAASAAGLAFTRELSWELARAGVLLVSGLARGIDAAAHEGALLGGGVTVAVLGCGLDVCYPPEHAALAAEIACQGALLSEWPAGTPPRPSYFPRRNRLISGLSDVVVVVEGSRRSGARHTVHYALQMGREVMAVPRDPLQPGSLLPNDLLRDGAAPVTGAADVLRVLAGIPRANASSARREREGGAG